MIFYKEFFTKIDQFSPDHYSEIYTMIQKLIQRDIEAIIFLEKIIAENNKEEKHDFTFFEKNKRLFGESFRFLKNNSSKEKELYKSINNIFLSLCSIVNNEYEIASYETFVLEYLDLDIPELKNFSCSPNDDFSISSQPHLCISDSNNNPHLSTIRRRLSSVKLDFKNFFYPFDIPNPSDRNCSIVVFDESEDYLNFSDNNPTINSRENTAGMFYGGKHTAHAVLLKYQNPKNNKTNYDYQLIVHEYIHHLSYKYFFDTNQKSNQLLRPWFTEGIATIYQVEYDQQFQLCTSQSSIEQIISSESASQLDYYGAALLVAFIDQLSIRNVTPYASIKSHIFNILTKNELQDEYYEQLLASLKNLENEFSTFKQEFCEQAKLRQNPVAMTIAIPH